jgi:hypothetical protein
MLPALLAVVAVGTMLYQALRIPAVAEVVFHLNTADHEAVTVLF